MHADFLLIMASSLLGTKHLIAYAVVIVVIIAAFFLLSSRRSAGMR